MCSLTYFGRQRQNPSAFCNFYACSSNLTRRNHAQISAGFVHMVLKQRRAQHKTFAFNIRKGVSATETFSKEAIEQTIPGEVILQEVSILNATDYAAILTDEGSELIGNRVSLQLVSSSQVDSETGFGKTAGEASYLKWNPFDGPIATDKHYEISFKWNTALGVPGAFLIKNMHSREFFLKSVTLDIPGQGKLRFQCNSWIAPYDISKTDRIFFSNKSYLPEETPEGLKNLRKQDMVELRGNGKGERKLYDRIYDYDVYNDIGNPDSIPELRRPVLGGSEDFPYPRRCRTGRPPCKTDPKSESQISKFFIPPDETFSHSDFSDFGDHSMYAYFKYLAHSWNAVAEGSERAFKTVEQIEQLYVQRFQRQYNYPSKPLKGILGFVRRLIDFARLAINIVPPLTVFERPQVYRANENAWKSDIEYARQALAGLNPMTIQCLQAFPPSSSLDPNIYGPQKSSITEQHIEKFLEGLSVQKAVNLKKLFILDYYDAYMLYAERINKLSDSKTYGSRTLFFLTNEGVLKPVAIELCLPPTAEEPEGVRNVYTPAVEGTEEGALWLLAKAHSRANDAGYHQLISHWLRTHAAMEPFVIATHRQLSRMHPMYKLLIPHYLHTISINAIARENLITAEGIIEKTFTPTKYSMEMSSKIYKDWKFNEQGLPADLLKRGMAIRDPTAPHGLRLMIEDYPFAVDGLEVWFSMKKWVSDYLNFYYKDDASMKRDQELQAWWSEIVNVGHGDLKDDLNRWYKMDTKEEVIEAVTTIIWIGSAHHAAVNFGQYDYGGYMPNLPTMTRQLIPNKGSIEYTKMVEDPYAYFLKTVSTRWQATIVMANLEILSNHARNERYIGQIDGSTLEWDDENEITEAFKQFSSRLVQVEKNVFSRNNNPNLKNRLGPALVPYTLLYPNTTNLSRFGGLTSRGVPNSISI